MKVRIATPLYSYTGKRSVVAAPTDPAVSALLARARGVARRRVGGHRGDVGIGPRQRGQLLR